MPWSNQGGGGWKSGGSGGGGGPWGQGPSGGGGGGGGQQPDLEELLKRSQDRIKQTIGGSGLPGPLMLLIAAPLVALVCFYAFTFRVNPDEVGVVMRFGRFDRQEPAGLHFRWPPPVEEVYKPKITRQNIIEIGLRSGTGGRGYQGARDTPESHMLTGDENIIDLEFVVYWRIKDASQYLFNIQNPESTVREVAESAMREIVGQSNIAPLLTEARQKTESDVQRLMQTTLDTYAAGIRIDQVTLQRVDPPAQVIDAFRDVQAARADKERLQNEANTYANKVVPEARGEADRILQAAEGYKQQTVAEANGQAARFVKIYDEFAKAPEVTRKRMFLETMERILGGSEKIIIDPRSTPQGVTPFLPLDQINRQSRPQGTN
jgi:membrane protease subunit HflK